MKILQIIVLCFCIGHLFGQTDSPYAKPWTYWWWMGSAVDKENINNQLLEFSKAGLGGVHIIPIYGAKGYEENFLPFLSEEWMEMVQYTIQRAGELNLGTDLTLGTGWPYGGGWISEEHSAKKLFIEEYFLNSSGEAALNLDTLKLKYGLDTLIAAYAFHNNDTVNLFLNSINETVTTEQSISERKIQLIGARSTGQKVKRAAPGGEGLVIDYFNHNAVTTYLEHFDSIFTNTLYPVQPRAFYHDSYEVYGADWTANFPSAFKDQHDYDLLDYIHILNDTSNSDYPLVVHDIRSTLAELLYSQFAENWTLWCKQHKGLSRYQAHGSPANILDLYALSDIPETESFGCSEFNIPCLACDPDYEEETFGRPNPLMMKFASSPAHLLNKPLVSSETGTWLANHFKVSLRRIKPQIDELFTAGINHIFYHGITYSPEEEGFPGWLFYASTNFGITSHFWDELPLLNRYIEICQTLLQNTKPDNNLLLYFPIDDLWTNYKGDILLMLEIHHYANWFSNSSFAETANLLWDNGYSFDYVSDRQIEQLKTDGQNNVFISNDSKYQTIIVPAAEYIPESTLVHLKQLAGKGVNIIFTSHLPKFYPGIAVNNAINPPVAEQNKLKVSEDILGDLIELNTPREEVKEKGLEFIRKRNSQGTLYFISNLNDRYIADTVELASQYEYLTIIDPLTNKRGYIETSAKFYLRMLPGESLFIQTSNKLPDEERLDTFQPYDTVQLDQTWSVSVEEGEEYGFKKEYRIDTLTSWTAWGVESLESFNGKARYTYDFSIDKSDNKVKRYLLKIDKVCESAKVIINGISCGTIWAYPNQLEFPVDIMQENNRIEIIVQNLSSNYMRIYDQQNPGWKKFYDINFVDITYNPFDASGWNLEPSGLIGNVYLISLK